MNDVQIVPIRLAYAWAETDPVLSDPDLEQHIADAAAQRVRENLEREVRRILGMNPDPRMDKVQVIRTIEVDGHNVVFIYAIERWAVAQC